MPNNTHQLTKSSYVKGCQCVKYLYLSTNRRELRDPTPPSKQVVYDRGHKVGALARDLFPGGIDVSPRDYDFASAAKRTQELIDQGQSVIYEATFIHDDVLVMVDILVKRDGLWYAHEVKSTGEVKDVHVIDAALQYLVITSAGLPLEDILIVHINKGYVRNGPLDLEQLFTTESILLEVLKIQPDVTSNIEKFKNILRLADVPNVNIGIHCTEPYPCDFKGYCWQDVPQPSVWDIAGLTGDRKAELHGRGIIRIEDITDDVPITERQRIQVDSHKNGTERINVAALKSFYDKLSYPICYLDFESINPAVPLYDGTRPFQQIVFQFSVHTQSSPDAQCIHREFLAMPIGDPRLEFVRALLDATDGAGTILVYNQSFEKSILRKLGKTFPEHAAGLNDRANKIEDLMKPFAQRDYYHPRQQGSHSIKNVLPSVAPELSYDHLPIADGTSASAAFESMIETSHLDHTKTRQYLMDYCRMDTLAMVKILDAIRKAIQTHNS